MKIDQTELKAAIKATTEKIRELKSRQREPHQPRWAKGKDDDALRLEKWRATRECMVAAASHGRIHIAGMSPEDQAKQINGLDAVFQLVPSESAAA